MDPIKIWFKSLHECDCFLVRRYYMAFPDDLTSILSLESDPSLQTNILTLSHLSTTVYKPRQSFYS